LVIGGIKILEKIKNMKTLILLRHAKSESFFDSKSDLDRNLLEVGLESAQKVSKIFKEHDIVPDIILCSTANRTKQTCDIFIQNTGFQTPIIYLEELYMATASEMFLMVQQYYKQYKKIMIIGHNDGISKFANRVSKNGCENLSTSALVVFNFRFFFDLYRGKTVFFINPKLI
jgi:phosphohistidine phosphatase